jgi:cation diffusion facilitator family transporter
MSHDHDLHSWRHDHVFGQDVRRAGEPRTLWVIAITAVTMVVEIAAGIAFGSMALLADGVHMSSHASALAITAFAYFYTRRHARDDRFNFGTGKINSLAALVSALLLVLFAVFMAWESVKRLMAPVAIGFNQAIFVAVLGLLVNGICLLILGGKEQLGGHHHHDHDDHDHDHEHAPGGDQNLLSAYLHVLADALTSVLAIAALLSGKYLGWVWLDPAMGILGAILVARWSVRLLGLSTRVLLDMRVPDEVRERIRGAIERVGDNRICDLHVWSVGPGIHAAAISIVSSDPKEPEFYRKLMPDRLGLVHTTFEMLRCRDCARRKRLAGADRPGSGKRRR